MILRLLRYNRRKKYLKSRGWYSNLNGGMTHGHCMAALDWHDIMEMSDAEFKLVVG